MGDIAVAGQPGPAAGHGSFTQTARPIVLQRNNLVEIAGTRSGKTIAYVLPMLINIETHSEEMAGEGPMGLVLVPQCSHSGCGWLPSY